MQTSTSETVLQLKEKLRSVLLKEKNIAVESPKFIRLRERFVDYKSIMRNNKKLKDYSLYDKKVIGVTVLDHEEDLESDEIVLCLKFWDANTKQLQQPRELPVKMNMDVSELVQKVAKLLGMNVLHAEIYLV